MAVGDPDPRSFDGFAEHYDAVASLQRKPDFFLRHLPTHCRRALDVGCGTGILARELARHFDFVLGVDLSEPMLAITRRKRSGRNIEYRRMDANHLALEGTYDAIVSHTTFHHLDDVPGALSALRAALAPEGRLILVDVIARFPIPRLTLVFAAMALVQLPVDLVWRGPEPAWRIFRFQVSRPWLRHLSSDRYLSRRAFRETYGKHLPGASFTSLGFMEGLVWQAPPAPSS